jgi:hypothetical protein
MFYGPFCISHFFACRLAGSHEAVGDDSCVAYSPDDGREELPRPNRLGPTDFPSEERNIILTNGKDLARGRAQAGENSRARQREPKAVGPSEEAGW